MDPIKYIFEKPVLTGRLARWQMLLFEYDIQYVTQKAIKGSILADHLAHQPLEDYQSMKIEFQDEDIMTLDDCEEIRPYDGPEQGFRGNFDLWTKGRPLKHPILNDRLPKATEVRVYPKSDMCE